MITLSEKACIRIDRVMYGYVVLVVLYQLLTLAFPVAFVASAFHLNRVSQALAVVGLLLFVLDALNTRRFLDKRYGVCLILVLVVLTISSLLLPGLGVFGNGKEPSIIANAKSIIWQLDQMLVIFPYCASLDRARFKKLARTLYWIISAVYIPCLIVSFWQYGHSLGYDAVYGTSTGTRQGFQEGRLFGLMMGVFSSGLMTLVLSSASVFFAVKEKSMAKRIVFLAFALVYALYSVLTETRSLVVALVVAVFVASLLFFIKKRAPQSMSSVAITVICSTVVSGFVVALYLGVGSLMAQIPAHNANIAAARAVVAEVHGESEFCALYHPEQETTDRAYPIIAVYLDGDLMLSYVGGSNPPYNKESLSFFEGDDAVEIVRFDEMGESDAPLAIERLDVGESAEVSNGRIAIWKYYLNVIIGSAKNVLIGLSPGYYMPAIYEQYSGTDLYIIEKIEENYPNMIANGLIYDVHNAYLSVLVQSGVLGCVFLLLFLWRLASDSFRTYLRKGEDHYELWAAITVIALVMAAVFFDSDLFFRTTSSSVVFWVLCGFVAGEVSRAKACHSAEEGE